MLMYVYPLVIKHGNGRFPINGAFIRKPLISMVHFPANHV